MSNPEADDERRAWLERLSDATARVAADLHGGDGSALHNLLDDVEALHQRLADQLEALTDDQPD